MTHRGALIALILAYYTCLGLMAWSVIGVMGFAIVYLFTLQVQYAFALLICIGSMVAFAVIGAIAHWWARS